MGTHGRTIAINAIPLLSALGGIGQYTYQLIRQFPLLSQRYDYTYYYGYFSRKVILGSKPAYRLKELLFKMPGIKGLVRQAVGASAKLHARSFDLYFEPNFIPLEIRANKVVITVHDFSLQLFPEAHPKDRVHYFRQNFLKNVRRSTRIITDSGYTRTEAIEMLRVPADMITPIHLGLDHDLFKIYPREVQDLCGRELRLPEKFILFVGTREPRKNLRRLAQAYAELPDEVQKEFSLVLVGPRGWGENDPFRGKRLGNRVMVLDYLDTQKLALVYNLASVLVYPSLYEGFGLPPLEAMACGCPVVVSNAGALPEVCGDAAVYVDPNDSESIVHGIQSALSSESVRKDLIERGLRRAKHFTWEKTARETLKVFDEVLDQR